MNPTAKPAETIRVQCTSSRCLTCAEITMEPSAEHMSDAEKAAHFPPKEITHCPFCGEPVEEC